MTVRIPLPVLAAAALAVAYALALALGAVAVAVDVERSAAAAPGLARAPIALGAVTVLIVAAMLFLLGALAAVLRKTDMLLVFAVTVTAALACVQALVVGTLAGFTALLGVLVALSAPLLLLLQPIARAWLPPIPLHDAVLLLLFGPIVGLALIAARQRTQSTMELVH